MCAPGWAHCAPRPKTEIKCQMIEESLVAWILYPGYCYKQPPRAGNESSRKLYNHRKGPIRLKEATDAFMSKILLRHYAKQAVHDTSQLWGNRSLQFCELATS